MVRPLAARCAGAATGKTDHGQSILRMPELPDVEVYRRHLARTSLHKTIERVSANGEKVLAVSPGTLRRHLKGHRLRSTRRHGKWILAEIEGDDSWLAFHFGMTGRVWHVDPDDTVPKGVRMRLGLADGDALVYTSERRLGTVTLVDGPDALVREHGLGPDALGLSRSSFASLLLDKGGTIKGALMDQSTLAGVGNIYADEMLFHAGIHPKTSVSELADKDIGRLHRHLQGVLKEAIQAHADPERMPRTWLTPHRDDRAARCPHCGGQLARDEVSGRTTVWCPRRV